MHEWRDVTCLFLLNTRRDFPWNAKKKLFAEENVPAEADFSMSSMSPLSCINDIIENLSHSESTEVAASTSKDLSYSNAAYFVIVLGKSWTTMRSKIILHEGKYNCNLIKRDSLLVGILFGNIPSYEHHCHLRTSDEKAIVVISREIGEKQAQMSLEYCTPSGTFEGEEILVMNKLFISALKLRKLSPETNMSTSTFQKPTKGKKHCCLFCRCMFVEISNHYIRKHSTEKEVVEILKLKANTPERNSALKLLRLRGDNHYNSQVQLSNRIPYRNLKKSTVAECINCPNCLSLIAPKNFARHERKCSGRLPNYKKVAPEARRTELNRRKMILERECVKTIVINELIAPIKVDAVLHEIVSDLCLKLLTERYAYKHRKSPTALRNDRQSLRRLARLLLEVKEVDPAIIDFEDCILYSNYDILMEAVFSVCSLNTETGEFGKPALAQALRSSITSLIEALQIYYLNKKMPNDSIELQNLERYLQLHKTNYGVYVGNLAHRNRLQVRAEKKNELPSTKDIKLFSQFICRQAAEAYKFLTEKEFDYDTWLQLGKAELAKIIVFNRRRVSGVASMSVRLFQQRIFLSEHKKSNLNVFERALSDRYQIMTLVGKRSHILHVLLDIDQCKHLELFLRLRKDAGVPETNKYLFGVPTSALYIDASVVLRNYSMACGAEKPLLLRTTYLRKQVATLSQLMTMDDNQIGQIAKLMGHSQKVHEQVYRQDEHLFQVTAWAKFLTIVSGDDINKYKGKTFDEIVNLATDLPEANDDPSQEAHFNVVDILGDEQEIQEQNQDINYKCFF